MFSPLFISHTIDTLDLLDVFDDLVTDDLERAGFDLYDVDPDTSCDFMMMQCAL